VTLPLLSSSRDRERIWRLGHSAPWTTPELGSGEAGREPRGEQGESGERHILDHQSTPATYAITGGEVGREANGENREGAIFLDHQRTPATNAVASGEEGRKEMGAMGIGSGSGSRLAFPQEEMGRRRCGREESSPHTTPGHAREAHKQPQPERQVP
jgi:hypothetical protein